MTISEIGAIVITMCVMIGVFFTILYWKIDNIEDDVNEIKRKKKEEK